MDDRSIGAPRMAFIQKNGGVAPRPMPDKGLVPSGVRPNPTVWKATVAVACGSSLRCVQDAVIAIQAIEIQPTRTFGDGQQHLMVAGKGAGCRH